LAGSLHAVGRYREAVEVFQRLIEEMDRSGRGGMLSRAIMRHNLALTLLELGENAEAEAIFREALEQAARADPGGRIIWQPTVHYAEAALTQARADSALAYFDRIVRQAVEDGNLYWEGRGVFGRARALLASGRLDAARHDARRLGEILVAHPAVKGTDDLVPDARILGGLIALAEGDTIAARTELLEGLRENGWFEGRRRKRLRPVAVWLAEAELAAGDPVEALRFAREAGDVATVDSIALRRSANVGEARLVVARALLATGDATGALSAALEARVALRAGAGAGHPRTREVERLLGALTPCGAAGCDRRGSESGPGGATEPIR
ncbi:MAG TPA: tetratricopeptide repeat protein, partial [Longimicrobiales bacterium]|nr:tetratricopeptide repeat protein [Longimicrobiales bacterium]